MNLRNDLTSRPWLRRVRMVMIFLALGGLGAQIGFGQEVKSPAPVAVTNPNDDISPKQFGRPMEIEDGNKGIRTIWMYEGRTTVDQRDPTRVVYYHGLDLALVPNEKPLPGFPTWVQDVTQRDGDTIIEARFRLSSLKLRRACEAKLLSDMRDFFDREKERLKITTLKVEVQKIPAWQLFIAIQDSATDLTLAYKSQHIANLGEDVAMSFRFKPEDLSLFMQVAKEGKLQFKPYYKVRADQIILGRKQTNVAYDMGLKVKQLLDHRQQPRLKNDEQNTVHPILQDDVNRISRQISMEINTQITASDPDVITFLHNDNMLVASCFDPANSMTYADFRRVFPAYSEEMLAEYLKPYGVTKIDRQETQTQDGKSKSDTKADEAGGGFSLGVTIPVGYVPINLGVTGQMENSHQVTDTIFNASGVRLVKGTNEKYYRPAEVKVFKLAEGYEQKKLSQASSITLTKGVVNSYLEESPFPQTYIASVVVKSYENTKSQNDHVANLLAKKAALEEVRRKEREKLATAIVEQQGLLGEIETYQREIHDHHQTVMANFPKSKERDAMKGELLHLKGVFGYEPPGGIDGLMQDHWTHRDNPNGPTRNEIVDAAIKAVADNDAMISTKSTSLKGSIASSRKLDGVVAKINQEIERIQKEIDSTTKDLLTVLER